MSSSVSSLSQGHSTGANSPRAFKERSPLTRTSSYFSNPNLGSEPALSSTSLQAQRADFERDFTAQRKSPESLGFETGPKTRLGIHTNFRFDPSYLMPCQRHAQRQVHFFLMEQPSDGSGDWKCIYRKSFLNGAEFFSTLHSRISHESKPTRDPNQITYRVSSLYQMVFMEEGIKTAYQLDSSTLIRLWSEEIETRKGERPHILTLHLGRDSGVQEERTYISVSFG